MNAWDHLPNARHIDWVLASLKQHPEIWATTRAAARQAAWEAAWEAAWDSARAAAYDAAWRAAKGAARGATRAAAYDATRAVILALIAYDDCGHLLNMPSEQLKTWALLTEQPAAVLLLSAVIVRERIRELETV